MNVMFQVADYFVRLRDKGGRLKLTVWNQTGEKLVSDFISADQTSPIWPKIEEMSSNDVVQAVQSRLYS